MAKENKPNSEARIAHMLEAINKILGFTSGMDVDGFIEDEVIQLAVIKLFEILGEAAYHVDKEFKNWNDHIEWTKIEGLRHVLVHDYYRIQPAVLWNTKEIYLPDLKKDIENLL